MVGKDQLQRLSMAGTILLEPDPPPWVRSRAPGLGLCLSVVLFGRAADAAPSGKASQEPSPEPVSLTCRTGWDGRDRELRD